MCAQKVVDVLGTDYFIFFKKYEEDDTFKRYEAGAYCSASRKQIVLCDMKTYPDWQDETEEACEHQTKKLLRHEIVHAFLIESGLSANSNASNAWSENEEMVDWFAMQGPKIYNAWQEVGAL